MTTEELNLLSREYVIKHLLNRIKRPVSLMIGVEYIQWKKN